MCIHGMLLALVLALPCAGHANDQTATIDIQGFVSFTDVADDSPFNPGNVLAGLEEQRYDLLLKPYIALEWGGLRANAKPRFAMTQMQIGDEGLSESNGYFQEWTVGYAGDRVSINAGRELLYWGPGVNFSPSNPFYASVNQINPFVEPGAGDFVRARYAWSSRLSLSLIRQVGAGRDEFNPEYMNFEPINALKLDLVASEFSLGGVLAEREQRPWIGAFGQWTISDALVGYFDSALRQGSENLAPRRAPQTPLGWELAPARSRNQWLSDILVGGSYTFLNGASLTLEYRYNQQGLTSTQLDDYYAMAEETSAAMLSEPRLIPDAVALLSQASNPFTRTLSRNYLTMQLLKRSALVEDLSLNLISQSSLDDLGTQLVGVATYYLAPQWRLNGYVVANFGGTDAEPGRYFDSALYLGITWFSGRLLK
jgi:hypothetical protein